MQLRIRDGQQADWSYVLDSFVKTYSASPHAKGVSRAVLASLMEPILRAWCMRVACDPDDETVIVGFVIYEPRPRGAAPCIAWIQVRGTWRRRGVARALLADIGEALDCPIQCETPFMVHRIGLEPGSPPIHRIADAHGVTLRFRPYSPIQLQMDEAARASGA